MSGTGPFRLDGQAAIVTGASSGLGAIIADALADAGCAVVLAARREQELDAPPRPSSPAADGRSPGGPTCATPATPRTWCARRSRPSGGSTGSS